MKLAITLAALVLASPSFPSENRPAAAPRVAPGLVDGPTAHRLQATGVVVVDVRTPSEFATGHVPGAKNIPYDEMEKRFSEVGPPSAPVLLYCRSGRRSGIAAQVLKEKGFSRLYDLQDYDRWVASEPK